MIHAKNYEIWSKFVKAMPKILWPLFSGHGVYFQNLQSSGYISAADSIGLSSFEFFWSAPNDTWFLQ